MSNQCMVDHRKTQDSVYILVGFHNQLAEFQWTIDKDTPESRVIPSQGRYQGLFGGRGLGGVSDHIK